MNPLTPLQKHKEDWKNCERCNLCEERKQVVLFRGDCPCQVLFVGEAPGYWEDELGSPFVAQAGDLLNTIIHNSIGVENTYRANKGRKEITLGFTNLVACIPRDEDKKDKVRMPEVKEVHSCFERLREIVLITNPKLIICVGKQSEHHLIHDKSNSRVKKTFHTKCVKCGLPQVHSMGGKNVCRLHHECIGYEIPMISILHPSFMLRRTPAEKSILQKRATVTISQAIEQVFP